MAHDFNNLLTVIIGYAAALKKQIPASERALATVAEIDRAATQAALLTSQLLAFSRKQITHFQVLDLNQHLRDMQDIVARLVGEDLELVVQLEDLPLLIRADAGQITQVLMNLAANARDAMPTGGKLTVETRSVLRSGEIPGANDSRSAGHYVLLTVTDTGDGMSAEVQAQIFEPFFTTKEAGSGTGLGLATTYGIVREHGGWIEVYSEPGHGTAFRIYFPEIRSEVLAGAVTTAASKQERRLATILLVEDQAPIRMLSQDVLEEAGHRVIAASNGPAALKLAENEPEIDLLVTDVVMPGMSGPQLAELLQRSRPELLVLYTSGYTDHALFRNATLEAGTAFLHKPFAPDSLVAKVDEILLQSSG